MSWLLGSRPLLPSFSELVTGLGNEIPPSTSNGLYTARTPQFSFDLGWAKEQAHDHPSKPDLINMDIFEHSPSKPGASPGNDSGSTDPGSQRPTLKRSYPEDEEFPTRAGSEAYPGLRLSPADPGEPALSCVFGGFVPNKKPRRDQNQPFNPLYTRDGSPRKRLTQACDRCRSQKIRCGLRGSQCVQCLTQGLGCTFTTHRHRPRIQGLHRGVRPAHRSPDHSTNTSVSPLRRPVGSIDADTVRVLDVAQLSPSPLEDLASPSAAKMPTETCTQAEKPSVHVTPSEAGDRHKPPVVDDLSIDIDPVLFDAKLTWHYIERFFTCTNRSPFVLLPEAAFIEWFAAADKSTSERMFLYAVICVGAHFSKQKSQLAHQIQFRRITEDALKNCQDWFTLPVIHTLLLLSSVCAFSGDAEAARLHSISAMRCCYGLQLNNDVSQPLRDASCGYVGKKQMAECGRRTFWLAFIRSLFWNCSLESLYGSPRLQGTLRLPCDDAAYEAGSVPDSPVFTISTSIGASKVMLGYDRPVVSPMALIVHVAAALDDALESTNLAARPVREEGYAASLTTASRELARQLTWWRQHATKTVLLHAHWAPAELHVMETCVSMAFHWCTRTNLLPPAQAKFHYHQTRYQAAQLLERLDAWQDGPDSSHTNVWTGDAFLGCAVFRAFDIITAAGLLSSVLDQRHRTDSGRLTLRSMATLAITVISDLAEHSQLAAQQLVPMKQRFAAVLSQSNTFTAHQKRAFYFARPLWESSDGKQNVMYGMPKSGILDFFGVDGGEDELLEMTIS